MATHAHKSKGGCFPGTRVCAADGCAEPGEYRAPATRPGEEAAVEGPRWQYFCLEHVRAFNARWNWFDGMSEEDIFRAQSPFPQWDGPQRKGRGATGDSAAFRDFADHLDDFYRGRESARGAGGRALPKEDRRALARLGLEEGATLGDVRHAYRRLVRRYHPDLNNGSRAHEGRLQALTEAYDQLRRSPAFVAFSEGASAGKP